MRGPLVQPRYWGEDATPFSDDGWAHFGDLGRLDEDGYLHVTGRLKDTIIRGGSNVNPYEVEDVLRRSAQIQDVVVVGHPDEDLGERATAFVVPAPGAEPTLEDLKAHLEEAGMARYKWPESLHVLDELPTGSTGKVDRKSLKERAA
jgi:acyl-CoA synthetase (AMP-forming)/AMP-acid ligase II